MSDAIQEAKRSFREHDSILRTSKALELGIHPRTLYRMRDSGVLERLARGLYRLVDLPPLSDPNLVTVALKVPHGVIWLVYVLAFHELTTEIPHAVDVALQKGSRRPRLEHPVLRVFCFSGPAWHEAGGACQADGASVRIRVPNETVDNMFKFRRLLGLEFAPKAINVYREWDLFHVGELLHYARICRVRTVMKPYLGALI